MITVSGNTRILQEEERIFTVFPTNYPKELESNYMPQDFSSYREAVEYAKTLDCDYTIESPM